jgi:hypothetical protein
MAENEPQEYKRLTREELDELAGEPLPERAAMSLINANLAAPVNVALAANILSDDSIAIANAEQNVDITQST